MYPAISSPNTIQFAIGGPEGGASQPPPIIPPKELSYFGPDGKPLWSGRFAENMVVVSCRKYEGWEISWPQAYKRLLTLLNCIDTYKPIKSIDYFVTDTFHAKNSDNALLSKNLFKSHQQIPDFLLSYDDPRWDFSQGQFRNHKGIGQILVRVEGRGIIQGDHTLVSINNVHSHRFKAPLQSLKDIIDTSTLSNDFNIFHDMNKDFLRGILDDDLLVRMRLKEGA